MTFVLVSCFPVTVQDLLTAGDVVPPSSRISMWRPNYVDSVFGPAPHYPATAAYRLELLYYSGLIIRDLNYGFCVPGRFLLHGAFIFSTRH